MSSTTITGTPIRKTDPHEKYSSSRPPTSGPMALPTEKPDTHTPMAAVRWRGSRNMLRISDMVEGIKVAPAMPSKARAAISIPALVEKAASADATPNAAAPLNSSLRRPMRSPSVPIVISDPAIMNP